MNRLRQVFGIGVALGVLACALSALRAPSEAAVAAAEATPVVQRRRPRARRAVAMVVSLATVATGFVLTPALTEVASAATKITICHRTHSTTNPYRKITVSTNATTNSKHGGHKVPSGSSNPAVYTSSFTYASNNKIWGDIIPGNTNGGAAYGGTNGTELNWSTAGIALFTNGCRAMTAKEFYDEETSPTGGNQTPATVVADLNEMAANEDAALLASIGSFSTSNVSSWDTAATVTTTAATSVAGTTATLNGTITVPSITTAIGFEYGTSSTLATKTSVSAGSNITGGATNQALTKAITGLSPGTTYYFRATGTTNPGTDTEGVLYGSILSFTTKAAQTITFDKPADMEVTAGSQALTETTTSASLAVTFTSNTTGICTVSGTSVTPVSTGTCSITASQAGNATYSAATDVTQTFEVIAAQTGTARTLTILGTSYDSGGYELDETAPTVQSQANAADGFGTKAFTSSTPTICTVTTGGAVTFVAAGTCKIGGTITAGNDGVTDYNSATAATVSFPITLVARTLSINGGSYNAGGYAFNASPPTITSTASKGDSHGTKSFSSSTTAVCTVDASTGQVAFVSTGSCTIASAITAANIYNSATATSVTFPVSGVSRTLTIDASSYNASGYSTGASPPTITSTASAGDTAGTKSYSSSTSSVCTVNASTGAVTFVSAGTCTIGASITSSGEFNAATATTISFNLSSPIVAPGSTTTTVPTTTSTTAPPTTTTTPPSTNVTPAADGTVRGVVWFDRNNNTSFDGREWILPGVQVRLTQVIAPSAVPASTEGGFQAAAFAPAASPISVVVTTDKDGRYVFTGLPFAQYSVSAVANIKGFDYTSDSDGNADWNVSVSVVTPGVPGIGDFAGLGKGEIIGQMFEQQTGNGLAFATIRCMWGGYDDVLGNGDDVPFELPADAEGRFDMAGIPYGNFSCSGVDNAGRRSAAVLAAVFSPEPQRAPLPVGRAAALPQTGGNVVRALLVALLSLGLGATLTVASRRHRRQTV
jgi:hypothetical protein